MDNLPEIDDCKQVYESYCEHVNRNLKNVGELVQVTLSSLIHSFFPQENFNLNSDKIEIVASRIRAEKPFIKKDTKSV